VAAPQGQLRVSRYFAALGAIVVALYALVLFTGPGSYADKLKPKLGLDLQGGTTVTLRASTPDGKQPKPDQLELARQILENRVNGTGVAEFEVLKENDRNIVINVPGKNNDDVKRIGEPAQLRFREMLKETPDVGAAGVIVPSATPTPSGTAKPSATPSGSAKPSATPSTKASGSGGAAPTPTPTPTPKPSASASGTPAPSDGTADKPTEAAVMKLINPLALQIASQAQSPEQLLDPQFEAAFASVTKLSAKQIAVLSPDLQYALPQITCQKLNDRPAGSIQDEKKQAVACDGSSKQFLEKASVLGTDVKSASANLNTQAGGWQVSLKFTSKGQDRWTSMTRKTVGKRMAAVLDNTVISSPTIEEIMPGDAQITGSFSSKEAKELASKLNYGALPLSFDQESLQSITPTLGIESLKAGLLAGGIGLGLVVVYSLIYYRALGFVTIASLVASASIIYATVILLGREIGFTLTLAGVAGFIVAVGITADSFVVFFERLKDEVKDGRSVRTAVPRAWARAQRTILSADSVSLLAAVVLYILAVGAVRGFAFTLGLSTVVDVLIVYLFTHPLVALLSRSRFFTAPRFSGLGNMKADTAPTDAARPGRVIPKES
jgi:preprotein translocase subunit SecD